MHVGDRVELVSMPGDVDPVAPGTRGTITRIDSDLRWGAIHVAWDNGRRLGLIAGVDRFRIVS